MYRTLPSLTVLLIGLSTIAAADTIVLTFPSAGTCASDATGTAGPITCTDGSRIFQGYGDTPTVDVTYIDVVGSPPHSMFWWSSLYNDLSEVVWANKNGRIEFAPLVSGPITLESLDVGYWLNIALPVTVRVLDLSNSAELYNSGVLNVGTSAVHLTPGVSSNNGLALVWETDVAGGKFGLDNITITAASSVPEPGTWTLVAAGVLGALWAHRSRQTRVGARNRVRQ